MSNEAVLEIPARAEYLYLVRSVVAAAASIDAGLSPARIADLRVAVSEAVTNAIKSHVEAGRSERIVVRCWVNEDRFVVQVSDHGAGFDQGALDPVPAPDDPARLGWEHGLGVPLMRILADETQIDSGAAGTSVRLVLFTSR